MHLVGGDYDVMGVTFPGVPGVVIGHNRAIAWGLTNGMVDDADFYIENAMRQMRSSTGWCELAAI